jgi:hypothetical protein
VQGLCLKEAPYNIAQQGPSKAVGPTHVAGISSKHGQNMQKVEGKDLPNVKQSPTQETSSSGILTQGANGKPVEVMGLQVTRPKLPKALDRRPKKTEAGQNGTRV